MNIQENAFKLIMTQDYLYCQYKQHLLINELQSPAELLGRKIHELLPTLPDISNDQIHEALGHKTRVHET